MAVVADDKPSNQPTPAGAEEVFVDRGKERKIFGITIAPWRSPINQGASRRYHAVALA